MLVYLSLGSNMGDSPVLLQSALERVDQLPETRVSRASRFYETEPWGELNQPAFLNIAAEIETELAPLELLNAAKQIEVDLGRQPGPRWGPRALDIDLILWGEQVVYDDALTIPHPRFRQRAFVLAPLCDIAPEARDPITGRTVRQLRDAAGVTGKVLPLT